MNNNYFYRAMHWSAKRSLAIAYRTHRAVIFSIAQHSCYLKSRQPSTQVRLSAQHKWNLSKPLTERCRPIGLQAYNNI